MSGDDEDLSLEEQVEIVQAVVDAATKLARQGHEQRGNAENN